MPYPLTYNQICAIAASLEELREDLELPVYVEGDVYSSPSPQAEVARMDPGEASRMVAIKVLEHPYVQEAFAEIDRTWEALKWALTQGDGAISTPPDELLPTINAAIDAAYLE